MDLDADHLVLRSDPLGLRPVYWTRHPDGSIISSSSLAEVVAQAGAPTEYDHEVVLLEALGLPPIGDFATRTRRRGIHRLPGGHQLWRRPDGSLALERYWSTDQLPDIDHRLRLSDATELLRERIDEAVRRCLPDDGGIAGHVSGGLDCTAVTCRAQSILADSGRSLTAAYSWAPDESIVPRGDNDERALLDDVGDRLGFPVRRLTTGDDGRWFDDLPDDLYPFTTHLHERFVLPDARSLGVSTMLSGWGGDELASFNGRGILRDLVRRGRWLTAFRNRQQHAALLGHPDDTMLGVVRNFVRMVVRDAPGPLPHLRHPLRHRRERAIAAEIDALIREASPAVADVVREQERRFASIRDHHEYQRVLLDNGHLQRRTHNWHQTGHVFGIEYRYPLLDLDVVAAALSLPWSAYMSDGWSRIAFRLAVEPWVPAAVAWNVTKQEPVLHSSEAPTHFSRIGDRRPADDGYRAVIDLARRVRSMEPHVSHATRAVQARPDLAPVIR